MSKKISLKKDKLFENIFNFARNGIAIIGLKGEWIKVNKSILKALGYTEEELYSMTFEAITHKDDLEMDLNYMQSLLKGDIDSYQIEKRYFHKYGHIIWAKLSVSLVRDDDGNPLYFISQIDDISERKAHDDRLEVMLNVAKQQNDRLSNFAEIITHNLKTHASNLTTIIGFLEEENHIITGEDDFMLLKGSVINLSQTVSHLTQVSKIKSINQEAIEPLCLHEYVEQAIYNVSALAKNINCKIINNVDRYLKIKGIPAYLDSVVLNFLTNAIKYSSDDRDLVIKLSSDVDGDYVVFSVEDNGLGIDLAKHGSKLFQMYKTFHKNKDSTGVGLFITRNHIESMGGFVKVKSKVGVGSTFVVYFKEAKEYVYEEVI